MKKIKIPSDLTSLAYNSIKEHILEGHLDQDSRLTESLLSDQLGISRSPIREALNSLATEGLITIEPRRGAFLRRFSVKEVSDLYELRKLLEGFAVQTAEITPKFLTGLDKSIERSTALLNSNKKREFIEEDMWFHGAIATATGNQPLFVTLENVQNQIWLCRCKTYNLSSSSAPENHRSIVEALRENDRRKAKIAMREHIEYVQQRLVAFLSAHPAASESEPGNGNRRRHLVSGPEAIV